MQGYNRKVILQKTIVTTINDDRERLSQSFTNENKKLSGPFYRSPSWCALLMFSDKDQVDEKPNRSTITDPTRPDPT